MFIKNIIGSIQDNIFVRIKNICLCDDKLLLVVNDLNNQVIITKDKRLDGIIYEIEGFAESINKMEENIVLKLEMIKLLYLLSFKRIIELYELDQSYFDKAYSKMDFAVLLPETDASKCDVANFIMFAYSLFYEHVISKINDEEAMINVHRFSISFRE